MKTSSKEAIKKLPASLDVLLTNDYNSLYKTYHDLAATSETYRNDGDLCKAL